DAVTVTIVNSAGSEVATLAHEVPVTRYKQFSLRWNGRLGPAHGYTLVSGPRGHTSLLANNLGPLAPAGDYRVRVSLHRQRRAVLSPRSFTLVRRGPADSRWRGREPARCWWCSRWFCSCAAGRTPSRCWRSSHCRFACRSRPTGAP